MEGEVARVNAQLQSQAFTKYSRTQAQQFAQTRKQAELMQQTWANAAASTGLFDVSSRKIKSHTDEWVKSVQRQRLSLRELMADRGAAAKQAYQQQLRMKNMAITSFGTDRQGNPLASIAVPRTALRDADSLRQKLGFGAHVAESISTQMINAGKNMQWAGRQLSMGFTAPLLAAGALSAKFAFDLDKQLTQTAKVYDTYANTQKGKEKELMTLRQDQLSMAKQIAKEYGMAAADTAAITAQLASAGQRGKALMEGTKETARFATLGDFDNDSAVKASITLKSVFGIQRNELKEAVDFMNNIENSTSLTMQDMATAIPTASGAVKALNGNYKDMIVLLTAMRERGFAPGESANALKAAGTRLIRPGPQVKKEFEELTGQSIIDIRDQANGDLIKMLLGVAKATENLTTVERQQAHAALFGTQQAVRLGAAMAGLVEAQKGVGQTAKAMEVAQISAADNAKVAAAEMAAQQKSVAGQFKRAVETIKVQTFEMGIAFLKAATIALQAGSTIIEVFQSLPKFAKKGLVVAAVIAAMAGPLLMFIGLSRNLFGQMIKGAAMMVNFATKTRLVTTEQAAGIKAAEWYNNALRTEADTTVALTLQLEALTNAYREASGAKQQFAGTLNTNGSFLSAGAPLGPLPQKKPTTSGSTYAGFDIMGSSANAKKGKMSGFQKTAAGGAGLSLASMVAMQTSSNQTVQNIAQWSMMAGMAAPVLSGLSKRFTILGTVGKLALNPWVAGVAVVGAGLYAWYKHTKRVNQELDDMYNNSEKLGKMFGLEDKGRTVNPALKNMSAEQQEQIKINKEKAKSVKLSEDMEKAYPKLISSIKAANDPQEKYNLALMQGLKVMNMGGTEKQAKQAIKAALDAAQGVADADKITARFDVDLGSQKQVTAQLKAQSDRMLADVREARALVAQQGLPGSGRAGVGTGGGGGNSPQARTMWKKQGTDLGALLFQGINLEGQEGIKIFDDVERTANELAKGSEIRARMTADAMLKSYGVGEKARERALDGMDQEKAGIQDQINLLKLLEDAGVAAAVAKTAQASFGMSDFGGKDVERVQNAYDRAYAASAATDEVEKQKDAAAGVVAELTKMNNGVAPLISGFGSMADAMAALGINTANAGAELDQLKAAAAGMASAAASTATDKFSKSVTTAASKGHTAALTNIQKQGEATAAALDKAGNAMDRRHSKQQDRLDAIWKRRKKALQDEEDLRKRVFEAEVTRIERLKELNNDNVDYRVAVNTGDLDAAAKIRNEIDAKAKTNALTDSDKAAQLVFEKQMEKLEKREEASKKALKNAQDIEKRRLDIQRESARKSVEIATAAENARYEAQKKAIQKGLNYIKEQNPQTQAELDKAIATAKKTYGIYGDDLEKASKDWGNNMYSNLAKRIRDAYKSITGQDFGKAGSKIAADFMKGVSGGKITTSQIITYMRTGKLPKDSGNTGANDPSRGHQTINHGGGALDKSSNNRAGYPHGAAPYPSEVTVLAKKSEYMMQTSAHKKYGTAAMDAINQGKAEIIRHGGGSIGLGTGPMALGRNSMKGAIEGGLDEGYENYKAAVEAAKKAAAAYGSGASMKGVDPNGWNKPWKGSYGTNNGHDYPLSYKPIYAPHSGRISAKSIPGYEPRVGHGGRGFRSYGQYIDFTGGGTNLMFAHLSKMAKSGSVKAGDYIGTTGETGNAHGPHVHVERNHSGNNGQFGEFFRSRGVKLLKGGTTRYDNTPAILHRNERTLSAPLTRKLDEGIDRIANGDVGGYNGEGNHYHIHGRDWTPEDIPKLAKEIKKEQDKDNARYSRKPKN